MYIYFSFNIPEFDEFLNPECDYQRKKGYIAYGIRGWDRTPLCFLKPTDRLYIVAHGCTSTVYLEP